MPLITYISPDPKHPSKGYPEWLTKQLATFRVRKVALRDALNCSEYTIQTIQDHVDYIRIRRPWLTKQFLASEAAAILNDDSATYYNADQLMQYLVGTPAYSRQTKFVRVEAVFGGEVECIKKYRELFGATCSGTEDEKKKAEAALSSFLAETCPEHAKAIYAKKHRDSLKEIPVPAFDWFSGRDFIPANTAVQNFRNVETLYRSMIAQGAIKITFGTRKTFFYVPMLEPPDGMRFDEAFLLMPASFPTPAADDEIRGEVKF